MLSGWTTGRQAWAWHGMVGMIDGYIVPKGGAGRAAPMRWARRGASA